MDESGQHYLGTALPLDDVDSSDVDLVGRLAELLTRLRTVTAGWTESQPVAGWIAAVQPGHRAADRGARQRHAGS